MIKSFKRFLAEGNGLYAIKGKGISMPGGSYTSVPVAGEGDDDIVLVFYDPIHDEEFEVQAQRPGGPYSVEYRKFDKVAKDLETLVKFLNAVKAKFQGVNDR